MATLKQSTINNDRSFGFPVGTILMYDKNDWVDNVTMKDWYACIAVNAFLGCPDLTDRFVIGCDEGFRIAYWNTSLFAFSGETTTRWGGLNTKLLSMNEIAQHLHNINHDHTTYTYNSSTYTHSHTFNRYNSYNTASLPETSMTRTIWSFTADFAQTTSATHWHPTQTTSSYAYTSYGSGTINSKIYDTAGNLQTQVSFNQRPAYYTVIFVRRCY